MKLPDDMPQSINFQFLEEHFPSLAALGGYAERYSFDDTNGALAKLRTYAEFLTKEIYRRNDFEIYSMDNFLGLLSGAEFMAVVPRPIIQQLQLLRKDGNKGVHEAKEVVSPKSMTIYLKTAHDLGKWLIMSCGLFKKDSFKPWVELEAPDAKAKKADKKKDKAFEKALEEEREETARLLKKLEKANEKLADAEKDKVRLERDAAQSAFKSHSNTAIDYLNISEAKTRKLLIDESLVNVGWDVQKVSTATVGLEVEVKNQPTTSGIGYVDYVLYDDHGKPLAVIEAKKTSKDVKKGKEQARMYAEALAKEFGYEPIIFYTNGFEIYIWNRGKNEPPRKIYGYYSKASLEAEFFQIKNRKDLNTIAPKQEITDRFYQLDAISRIAKQFSSNRRKALVIQATGTGKTRVAISLSDVMMRAKWAKRILFLCDRNELVKQAADAYTDLLGLNCTILKGSKPEMDNRIFVATYPSMLARMYSLDTGFFDLIIADESHRSIYNRYLDIFLYFDAFNVGLTATPVKFMERNTFKMFTCEDEDPTAQHTFEEAIKHDPPYLSDFSVKKVTTKFLKHGIKWKELTDKQKEQLKEEKEIQDPEAIAVKGEQIGRKLLVTDTDRFIIRNLMENGIKNTNHSRIGKTIIFAGCHKHAEHIVELFDKMYPELGGNHCKVITSSVERAEALITEFKDISNTLDIAVSVDMLDTGIDVPEIVNLVFAKSVKSFAKFWQMIGRGTRLSKDLFGPGHDKKEFLIFDHYKNFEFFDVDYKEKEQTRQKSLLEVLFETRIEMGEAAIDAQDMDALSLATKLLKADVNDLPKDCVAVMDERQTIEQVKAANDWMDPVIKKLMRLRLARIMGRRVIIKKELAHEFDLLMARLQVNRLKKTSKVDDLAGMVINLVSRLAINLPEVAAKLTHITKAKTRKYLTTDATILELDALRLELRDIIDKTIKGTGGGGNRIPTLGVIQDSDFESETTKVATSHETYPAYRERVHDVLERILEESPVLQKIKSGEEVTDTELEELSEQVITQDPTIDIHDILSYPEAGANLADALRGIVGLDGEKAETYFKTFLESHPNLQPLQIKFLEYVQQHIQKFGPLKKADLYELPSVPSVGSFTHAFPTILEQKSILSLIEEINSGVA